eukprot:m.231638 g.231638  ORF g.231638 m.231638 type:complete len:1273 (+) comp26466_c1_seq18:216-4034(+)
MTDSPDTPQPLLEEPSSDSTSPISSSVAPQAIPASVTPQEDSPISFFVQLPHQKEPLKVQLFPLDQVQELRQALWDLPECIHLTCFSLEFNDLKLNDYTEIGKIPNFKDGDTINLCEDIYCERTAKRHIGRLLELISHAHHPFERPGTSAGMMSIPVLPYLLHAAFTSAKSSQSRHKNNTSNKLGDNSTPNGSHSQNRKKNKQKARENSPQTPAEHLNQNGTSSPTSDAGVPPESADKQQADPDPLAHISNLQTSVLSQRKEAICLRQLVYNGWNPPPGNRQLQGDLFYLTVETMEKESFSVTASVHGFFVNRSTTENFDPREATKPYRCHSLITLLQTISPMFKSKFAFICSSYVDGRVLESVPAPQPAPVWVYPYQTHSADNARSNSVFDNSFDFHDPTSGQVRDWNEEFQSLRAYPCSDAKSSFLRDLSLFKLETDFVTAAKQGAKEVVIGNVKPLNPQEDRRLQMFVWNNIFFTFAVDNRKIFQFLGGDDAAHASAANDLRALSAVLRLKQDKIFTIATVLVDVRGHRIVCQSIIPGLLRPPVDGTQPIVYGLGEDNVMQVDETFVENFSSMAGHLYLKTHKIVDAAGTEYMIQTSQCKGLRGTDKRDYLLDLYRLCPPDANFLLPETTEKEEEEKIKDWKPKHALYVLRHELLRRFYESKCASLVQNRFIDNVTTSSSSTDEIPAEKSEAQQENKQEIEKEEEVEPTNQHQQDTSESDSQNPSEPKKVLINSAGVQELKKLSIKFNPDVLWTDLEAAAFQNNPDSSAAPIKLGDSAEEIQEDIKAIRDVCKYLCDDIIPRFATELASLVVSPLDGVTLAEIMHSRGINMRYLGAIATKLQSLELPGVPSALALIVSEIIVRSAKYLLRKTMRELSDTPYFLSDAVAHFLNCFLSQPKKKKSKGSGFSSEWSVASLWKAIRSTAARKFRFDLPVNAMEKFSIKKLGVLRSLCLATGVCLSAHRYDLRPSSTCAFQPADILDLVVVVTANTRPNENAQSIFDTACQHLQRGHYKEAFEGFNNASLQFTQIYGHLHTMSGLCHQHMATILFRSRDFANAVKHQEHAVLVYERAHGLEHPDTIQAYMTLAHINSSANQLHEAISCCHHARQLLKLVCVNDHPELAAINSQLGQIYLHNNELDEAEKYLNECLEIQQRLYGPSGLHLANSYQHLGKIAHLKNDFRTALTHERAAQSIFEPLLGKDHKRTQGSTNLIRQYAAEAVKLETIQARIKQNAQQQVAVSGQKKSSAKNAKRRQKRKAARANGEVLQN